MSTAKSSSASMTPCSRPNAGPWVVRATAGRVTVRPAGAGAAKTAVAEKTLPIGLLSSLYAGLVAPRDLVLLGALDNDDPRLEVLSALFTGPVPWMPVGF